MNRFVYTLLFLIMGSVAMAQITITSADMPNVDDTYIVSEALTVSLSTDPETTGEGIVWDFTDLAPQVQKILPYLSVLESPIVYQAFFTGRATISQKSTPTWISTLQGIMDNFGWELDVTDYYDYYKENSSSFSRYGFGMTLYGVPMPVPYGAEPYEASGHDPDTLYTFPLNYGDTIESSTYFTFGLPFDIPFIGEATYTQHIDRTTVVDGWGTLVTPYGTFDVLRVKSVMEQEHEISGIFSFNTTTTEYVWLGNGQGVPLMKLSDIMGVKSIVYQDSLRTGIIADTDEATEADTTEIIFMGKEISFGDNGLCFCPYCINLDTLTRVRFESQNGSTELFPYELELLDGDTAKFSINIFFPYDSDTGSYTIHVGDGRSCEMALDFTLNKALPQAPIANTLGYQITDEHNVEVEGMVNAMNDFTDVFFDYGTDTGSYSTYVVSEHTDFRGKWPEDVGAELQGLPRGEKYYYRVRAINSIDTAYGKNSTFTLTDRPYAETLYADSLNVDYAKLKGKVSANYLSTTVFFIYGTDTTYGDTAYASPDTLDGDLMTHALAEIDGLEGGGTYHYRIVAVNADGTTMGRDTSFSLPSLPTVTTGTYSKLPSGAYKLTGTVNPNGQTAKVYFEYGPTGSFINQLSANPESEVDGKEEKSVFAYMFEWEDGKDYQYRVKASNDYGTVFGDTVSINITGIELKEAGMFNIYPNPSADGTFHYETATDNAGPANLQIYEPSGKLVKELSATEPRGSFQMPKAGVFYLKYSKGGQAEKIYKLIVLP